MRADASIRYTYYRNLNSQSCVDYDLNNCRNIYSQPILMTDRPHKLITNATDLISLLINGSLYSKSSANCETYKLSNFLNLHIISFLRLKEIKKSITLIISMRMAM